MSKLFEPITVNGLHIPNRFVRSATGESMAADDGGITEDIVDIYRALAEGGVGLIISGHTFVKANGRAGLGMTGIDSDELIPGWHRLVAAVHAADSKIAMQLNHAGRQTNPKIIGDRPVAPSSVPAEGSGFIPRELGGEEIEDIIKCFGKAAARARAAGFDAVQIHCAHGYLLSEFISPHTNRRTDEWGGSEDGRARMLMEVYAAIRTAVGDDYPVMVKLNAVDFLDDGLTIEMSTAIAKRLQDAGIDAIEISAGMAVTADKIVRKGIDSPEDEAYFMPFAREFKRAVSVPIMLVGGMRSRIVMEHVVAEGLAEFVSLCRPFIREPDLVRKLQSGEIDRAGCTSCNLCGSPRRRGKLRCVLLEKQGVQ